MHYYTCIRIYIYIYMYIYTHICHICTYTHTVFTSFSLPHCCLTPTKRLCAIACEKKKKKIHTYMLLVCYTYPYMYIYIYIYIYVYVCVYIYIYIYIYTYGPRGRSGPGGGLRRSSKWRRHPEGRQTRCFRKRATSAPSEGPAHGLDFARRYEFSSELCRRRSGMCTEVARSVPLETRGPVCRSRHGRSLCQASVARADPATGAVTRRAHHDGTLGVESSVHMTQDVARPPCFSRCASCRALALNQAVASASDASIARAPSATGV